MSENLKLWNAVEKTNPKYTKQANVGGNKITSIAPQYQIMNVTEQFGSYGKTWGFKNIELDYTLVSEFNLIVFKAIFFYPNGEFPTINSIKMFMDNAKTKIDKVGRRKYLLHKQLPVPCLQSDFHGRGHKLLLSRITSS